MPPGMWQGLKGSGVPLRGKRISKLGAGNLLQQGPPGRGRKVTSSWQLGGVHRKHSHIRKGPLMEPRGENWSWRPP